MSKCGAVEELQRRISREGWPRLSDDEFDILCHAVDIGEPLVIQDLAEAVDWTANDADNAVMRARHSADSLIRQGFLYVTGEGYYRASRRGQAYLEMVPPAGVEV